MGLPALPIKRFSVIARDYEFHVPRKNTDAPESTSILRGLESLANQNFKDFDLIICHDGPKSKSYIDEGIDFQSMGLNPLLINTKDRMNLYGHPSADLAMKYAYTNGIGEYYIQFNIDNVFTEDAFEKIDDYISKSEDEVFIFDVYHWKLGKTLAGNKPVINEIDAMQLVAHRDVWKQNNFWHSNDFAADGIIYEDICNKNSWTHIPFCLGQNF